MEELTRRTNQEVARYRGRLLRVRGLKLAARGAFGLLLIVLAICVIALWIGSDWLLAEVLVFALGLIVVSAFAFWRAQSDLRRKICERDLVADLDRYIEAAGALALAHEFKDDENPFTQPIRARAAAALASHDLRAWHPTLPQRAIVQLGIILLVTAAALTTLATLDREAEQKIATAALSMLDKIALEAPPEAKPLVAAIKPEDDEASAAQEITKPAAKSEREENPESELGKLVLPEDAVHGEASDETKKGAREDESAPGNPKSRATTDINPFADPSQDGDAVKRIGEGDQGGTNHPSGDETGMRRNRGPVKKPEFKRRDYEEIEKRFTPEIGKGETKTIRAEKEVATLGDGEVAVANRQIGGLPKDAALPSDRVKAANPLTKDEAEFVARWRR